MRLKVSTEGEQRTISTGDATLEEARHWRQRTGQGSLNLKREEGTKKGFSVGSGEPKDTQGER